MIKYVCVWDTSYSDGTRRIERVGELAGWRKPTDSCIRVGGNIFLQRWFTSDEEASEYIDKHYNERH